MKFKYGETMSALPKPTPEPEDHKPPIWILVEQISKLFHKAIKDLKMKKQ